MNIQKIKEIIDLPLISDKDKEGLIIDEISKDENVLLFLIAILKSERKRKSELILDMNILLSKADIGLDNPELNEDKFIQQEIKSFYEKHKISHCFRP